MKLLAFLAADYANIEQSGKLNVMGIFNDINAAQFPAKRPSMHIVVKLGAELGETNATRHVTIKLIDEDGYELVNLSRDIELGSRVAGRMPEFNFIVGLNDIVFPRPGRYEFVVLVDNDSKGEIPIYLNEVSPSAE